MRETVEEIKKIIFTSCPVTTELIVKTLEENGKSFSLYGEGKGEYLIFDTFERAMVLGAYDGLIGSEFAVYPVDGETVKSLCVRHRLRITECRRLFERLKGSNGVLWFTGEGKKKVVELTFDLFTSLLSQGEGNDK